MDVCRFLNFISSAGATSAAISLRWLKDAQEAVDRARKAAMENYRLDDNGRESKCTGFRLRGVSLVAQADL